MLDGEMTPGYAPLPNPGSPRMTVADMPLLKGAEK